MDKMLDAGDYTLVFSNPDIILYGSVDGNPYAYMDGAEEFAKSFFSEDVKLKNHTYERNLTKAKSWLLGTLYHGNKNNIREVMKLTGYRSVNSVYTAIRSFGPLRSIEEAENIAFMKRYGKNASAAMHDIMLKHSRHMSNVMKGRWEEDRKNEKHPLKESIRTGKRMNKVLKGSVLIKNESGT
jgi:hypothetical protein